ncbi:hypothetical protein AVDCRST_MAG84-7288 [uncultured Microcoleus sp.]|uniref:Uncharacterized protein n=1 Tax=uncultured Microcoleus sp. TaxID=259945 RepID=A0A6J4PS89_9CYAN|nr:hypothetical protein AVDCRST_MAG84-7288 [uncultured Microcoleus sp.]
MIEPSFLDLCLPRQEPDRSYQNFWNILRHYKGCSLSIAIICFTNIYKYKVCALQPTILIGARH